MTDVPQPAPEPYTAGDHVQIYLRPDDTDHRYHGTVCEVTDVHTDDLDEETGRPFDAYSYTVQSTDSGDEPPLTFRHQDLVPTVPER